MIFGKRHVPATAVFDACANDLHCTASLVENCHIVSMTGLFSRNSYYGTPATRYPGLRDRVPMSFIWPLDVPSDTECYWLYRAILNVTGCLMQTVMGLQQQVQTTNIREFGLCHFDRTSVGGGQVAIVGTRAAFPRRGKYRHLTDVCQIGESRLIWGGFFKLLLNLGKM